MKTLSIFALLMGFSQTVLAVDDYPFWICENFTVEVNDLNEFSVTNRGSRYPLNLEQSEAGNPDEPTDIVRFNADLPNGSIEINQVTEWNPNRDGVKSNTAEAIVRVGHQAKTITCRQSVDE